MPRVTKEIQRALVDSGVYPPRHQRGCLKNYARILPTLLAAKGYGIEEIRVKVREDYDQLPCTCKEADVIRE